MKGFSLYSTLFHSMIGSMGEFGMHAGLPNLPHACGADLDMLRRDASIQDEQYLVLRCSAVWYDSSVIDAKPPGRILKLKEPCIYY
jgi:hypothetical protein